MVSFSGEYECRIDPKGRLALPAKVKARLPEPYADEVVLRMSPERCLLIYAVPEFERIASRISGLDEFNPGHRKLQRLFYRSVREVGLDSAGRILLPKAMIAHANLGKDALLIGMGDRLEVWNPEICDESLSGEDFSDLAQEFLGAD
ncbi:transcriptional regulator MraZ [Fulvitalea axinellae]|uniref:Transcriptional regulator MraZ n=1 Tax=Fulvitalea axinellae TaxID=1182444 RepID=A0AAU9CCE6_9BACT|nr:transcriptional regulator MraZ [Fulvitalea axinellae]